MKIIHLSHTGLAYMPARFVDLTNKYTKHNAILMQERELLCGNPLNINIPKSKDEIISELQNADFLHFHGSIIYDKKKFKGIDISPYMNKPKLLHFHGSPQRENPRKYRRKEKIIVSTPEMLPLFHNAIYFPNLIDEKDKELYKEFSGNSIVKVCHHFSFHSKLKNTEEFLWAMSKNKRDYISFCYIPRFELKEALIARSKCNAVFDHFQGYYGVISIEAMAQGLAVINNCSKFCLSIINDFFGSLPPWILCDDREKLLYANTYTIKEKQEESKKFIENVWSGEKNINRLIDLYKKL